MKQKEEVVNINFFKKVWYSITKFEQYPAMATEGVKRAIKYLMMLTAILAIFTTIGALLQMKISIEDFAQYVQENIPEFSYSEGMLSMEVQEQMIIEDVKDSGIDRVVIDTISETDEQKEQVEKDNLTNGITVFLFKDQIILGAKTENDEVARQSYTYNDFIASYTGENIEKFNKTEFVQYLTSEKMGTFYSSNSISMFVYYFIENLIVTIVYSLEIALLGWITTVILRIKMRFKALYNMAVYSTTLPTILTMIYVIVNYFIDFTISNFEIAYVAIAYIYLVATIFIIKDDFIKKMQEVEKIKQEQIKVREEIKEEKPEKKEEQEDKKQDNKDDEPQGSET